MKKILMVLFYVALGFGLSLGDIPSVCAQEEGVTEEFTLEEITVTAQKRVQNQQKVSIAMEVFQGDQLRELGRSDLDSILAGLGTAHIQTSAEGFRVTLRGVGFDTPAGFGEGAAVSPGSAALHVDGVFSLSRSQTTGFFDVERVEVLFGPQSTMYAANAPGGIVNIETVRPKLDKIELSGLLEYGNYNLIHGESVINAPISDKVALRGAANFNKHDGYLSNNSWDEDSKSVRLRSLFKPNDRVSFLITGQYDTSTSRGQDGVPVFINEGGLENPWYTPAVLTGLPTTTTQYKLTANVELDLGFGIMTIVPTKSDDTYYRTSTSVAAAGNTTYQVADGWNYEKGIEVRMISPSESKLVWVTALNWFDGGRYRESKTANDPGMTTTYSITAYAYSQSQKAILGNLTVPLTDQFRGVFGARYSKDEAMSTTRIKLGTGRETTSDMIHNAPDFRLGMEYDIWDAGMFYANYASSYRVKDEAMNWRGEAYDAERLKAYTIGLKSRFFKNRLQANISAYYYDQTNRMLSYQERYFYIIGSSPMIPVYYDYATKKYYDRPGGNLVPTSSVGFSTDQGGRTPADLRIYGVDTQISAMITPEDQFDLNISYLDAWITKAVVDFEHKDQFNYPGYVVLSDRSPTFSPKLTVSLNYNHVFNLANGDAITARLDTRYQSAHFVDFHDVVQGFDYRPYRVQEAHHIDNVSIIYANSSGRWTVSGYLKNMWNYAAKRWMAGTTRMQIGPPRTYGFVFSVKYSE